MKLSALASGSSGNCFYIENDKSAVLIDAGISCKQIVERLGKIGKKPENIRGIFITHEHSDHIKGADVFARSFNIPVFATKKTAENCFLCSNENLIQTIRNDETTKIRGMTVEAFSKSHKAADPVSYSVTANKKASVITDIGYGCKNVVENISDSDFLFLESNHDLEMLESGPYPYYLKRWIMGNDGHISNLNSALAVLEYAPRKLKSIVLSHLSQTNNTPSLALKTFTNILKERSDLSPKISLSVREIPTGLFNI